MRTWFLAMLLVGVWSIVWAADPLTIHPPKLNPLRSLPATAATDAMLVGLRARSEAAAVASLALVQKKWPAPLVFTSNGEHIIRSPCGQAQVLALSAWLGLGDEKQRALWRSESARLCVALAKAHKAHGGVWGEDWQSALWLGNLARAAWFLGDALDAEGQRLVAAVIVREADRFLTKPAEGWRARDRMGGDTKGEENAWNTGGMMMGVAMLRDHPNRQAWLRQAVSYAMTAVAVKADLADTTVVNGRAIKDWTPAWCLSDDGLVANHNIYPHPNYTSASIASDQMTVILTLADEPVPVALRHNLPRIFNGFTVKTWPTPEFAASGPIFQPDGTIAWPGKGEAERAKEISGYLGFDMTMQLMQLDPEITAAAHTWESRHFAASENSSRGTKRVNDGIDSGSVRSYLTRLVLLSGVARFSAEPAAAGVVP